MSVRMIDLLVGTKFWVINGHWDGEIVEKENKKYIRSYSGNTLVNEFLIEEDYELEIDIKNQKYNEKFENNLDPIRVIKQLIDNKEDNLMSIFGEDYIAMTEIIIDMFKHNGYKMNVEKIK